jgi:mono/diheme cytochrome c family protein
MIKRLAITIIGLSLLAATACKQQTTTTSSSTTAKPGASSTPDQFANARGYYAKDCQTCHGANGEGGPVKLEDGTKLKVPSLREGHALRHSDEEFAKQITKGGDGMPAFEKKLTPNQMNELIRFIRHEYQGK